MTIRKVSWLILLFVASYFAAKTVSGTSETEHPADVDLKQTAPVPGNAPDVFEANEPRSGFAATLASLSRVERAFLSGNFETLLLSGEMPRAAAAAWADADPEGLWHWIEEGGGDRFELPGITGIHRPLFANWLKRDPDAAIDALRKTHRYGRWNATMGIVNLLSGDDPNVAHEVGLRLDTLMGKFRPESGDSGGTLNRGKESVENMWRLPDSHGKGQMLRAAVAGWFGKDWKAAKDWAAALPDSQRAEMERSLFSEGLPRNVLNDPDGQSWVTEWLAREENRALRTKLGSQVATAMAKEDPAKAIEWIRENLGGAALASAAGAVVATQVTDDVTAAIGMVDALPPGGVRLQAGRRLIAAMVQKDSRAAFERALSEQQNGFDVGNQGWGRLGTNLAIKHPDEIRRILTEPPEALPPVFESRALTHLSITHPETTLNWALDLGGERGTKIAERVLQSWRAQDSVAAEKWERQAGR